MSHREPACAPEPDRTETGPVKAPSHAPGTALVVCVVSPVMLVATFIMARQHGWLDPRTTTLGFVAAVLAMVCLPLAVRRSGALPLSLTVLMVCTGGLMHLTQPDNASSMGPITVGLVYASVTAGMGGTLAVVAGSVVAVALPAALVDPGLQASLPDALRLGPRLSTLTVLAFLTVLSTATLDSAIVELRTRIADNSRLNESLQVAIHELSDQVEQRTASLEQQRAELAQVNAALTMSVADAETLATHLHWQATHDDLTGLLNRRGFTSALRAALADSGGVLALADLDHFKKVNDTYGHAVGDAVLRCVAQELSTVAPSDAAVGRIGGEEFAILIPADAAAPPEQLRTWIEQVLCRISALDWSALTGRDWPLTTSIGVVPFARHPGGLATAAGITTALRWADRALYQAKDAGRDTAALVADQLQFASIDNTTGTTDTAKNAGSAHNPSGSTILIPNRAQATSTSLT